MNSLYQIKHLIDIIQLGTEWSRKLKFSVFVDWIMATSSLTELVSSDSYDNLFIVLRKYDTRYVMFTRYQRFMCARIAVFSLIDIVDQSRSLTYGHNIGTHTHTRCAITIQRFCLSISIVTFNVEKHNIGIHSIKNLKDVSIMGWLCSTFIRMLFE